MIIFFVDQNLKKLPLSEILDIEKLNIDYNIEIYDLKSYYKNRNNPNHKDYKETKDKFELYIKGLAEEGIGYKGNEADSKDITEQMRM